MFAGATAFASAVAFGLALLVVARPGSGLIAPATPLAWGLAAVVLLAQTVALLWADSAPAVALIAVAALPAWLAAVSVGDVLTVTDLPVIVASYAAATRLPSYGLRWPIPAAFLLVVAGHSANGMIQADAWGVALGAAALQAVVVIGGPLLVAVAVVGRREARAARVGELQAMAREHDARVEAALAVERAAMARELHDIAAHHLSGIALMSAAISRQIDTAPEKAKASLQEVRAESSRVLDELRRVVGLLRSGDRAPEDPETLAAVADLVEQRRAAGMRVELRLESRDGSGIVEGLGPIAQRAGYRIVQEALSNAAAHAPGAACSVEVDDRHAERVTVRVRNRLAAGAAGTAGPAPRGGFGLLGMRERAQLIGGELTFGPTPDGEWEVRLMIPKERSR
ncbi:hypothetical protein GCM10022286_14060 [Gryllotalpicola daejeonensis]|uniref:histidine kinase n=1 Tax=Gryllotalpicola daejeonensis TaxID=993087 RepID=A0ABP7ZJ07_9MICO